LKSSGTQEQPLILVPFGDRRQIQRCGVQALWLEPDIGESGHARLIELDAADDEKRDRETGLRRRGEPLQASHTQSASEGVVLERVDDRRPAEPKRRQQPQHDTGDEAEGNALQDQPRIGLEQIELRPREIVRPRDGRRYSKQKRGRQAAAEHGHGERLAEVVPHQAPAARTQCQSDRQFPLAHRAPNQHHSRDVQPDDEQHHAGQTKHHQPCVRYLGPQPRPGRKVRFDAAGLLPIARWIAPGKCRHDGLHDRIRLSHGGALGQPRYQVNPGGIAGEAGALGGDQSRVPRERQPQLIVALVHAAHVAAETFRRDADHDVCGLVDGNRAADDVGIAAEAQLPHPVADDGFRFGARRVIGRSKAGPARQRDADRREVVARHVQRRHRYRGALLRLLIEAFPAAPTGDDHTAGGAADLQIVRVRPGVDDAGSRLRQQLSARPDHELDQPIVIDAGRCADHQAEEQKDGYDDAHPKAQRCDAHRGERPCLDERARGMKKVGEAVNHSCLRLVVSQRIPIDAPSFAS
jgi:hypothetical protein